MASGIIIVVRRTWAIPAPNCDADWVEHTIRGDELWPSERRYFRVSKCCDEERRRVSKQDAKVPKGGDEA